MVFRGGGLPLSRPPGALALLGLLMAANAFVVALHFTERYWYFSLENDGGLGGRLGQGQLALLALLIGATFAVTREPVHLAWSALVAVAFVDDTWEVHERVGERLAEGLGLPAILGLREVDLGELMVWGAMGVVLITCLVVAHLRSGLRARRESRWFAGMVAALILFAVVVDMLHIATGHGASLTFAAVEDGGELVVKTLWIVLAYAVLMDRRERAAGGPIAARARSREGSAGRARG